MVKNDKIRAGISCAIISVMIAYFTNGFFLRDYNVPYCYEGDSMGTLTMVGNMVRGHWIYEYPELGYPFGEDYSNLMVFYNFHAILIKAISFFLKDNVGAIINTSYLVSFFLITICAFFAFSALFISKGVSCILAILYAHLPYHYFCNANHLFLTFYWGVPLVGLSLIWLFKGELKINSKKKYKLMASVVFCALLGLSDLYYSFLFCLLLVVALCCFSFIQRTFDLIMPSILLILSNVFFVFLQAIPIIVTVFKNKRTSEFLINRSSHDVEEMSLRISTMFMPIHGHRLQLLSNIRENYEHLYSITTSNCMSSLGLIMGLGVCISIAGILKCNGKKLDTYFEIISILLIIILSIASFGGLCDFIGMVSSSVRAYVRYIVYIAFFSCSTLGIILDSLISRFDERVNGRRLVYGGILMLIIGVLDQTSLDYMFYSDYNSFEYKYETDANIIKRRGRSDQNFVKEIEKNLKQYKNIFELPIKADNMWNTFPNGRVGGNELLRPSVYAKNTKWSYGNNYGDKSDVWLKKMSTLKIKKLLPIMALEGFGGIYIDSRGYSKVDLKKTMSSISKITGSEPIESEDGDMYFYDIEEYVERKRNSIKEDKAKTLRDFFENDFAGEYNITYKANELKYKKKVKVNKTTKSVNYGKGTVQYGPYVSLPGGVYKVVYRGENLSNLVVWSTCNAGEINNKVSMVRKGKRKIVYKVFLQSNNREVEFLSEDKKGDNVQLLEIKVKGYIPKNIKQIIEESSFWN